MTDQHDAIKPKKAWYKRWWAITIYIFFGVIVITGINGGFDEDATTAQKEETTKDTATEAPEDNETEEPKDEPAEGTEEAEDSEEPAPASPEEQIESATAADNVEANYEPDSGVLFIQFDIADSLTKGFTAKSAQDDTVALLEAADDSGIDFEKVFIQGYFPMTDQYGNTEDSMILNVGYTPSIIQQINFDNPTVRDTIWDIREQGMVHQELEN